MDTHIEQKLIEELQQMDQLFDLLYPINRSITGEGVRQTFNILKEIIPLDVFFIPTGTKVFDWEIPKEWKIHEGWLKGPDGKKIVDFSDHNLHVVNYSTSVDRKLSLEELKPNLYTIPNLPEAIPYVISYYRERWGLCLPYSTYESLEEGTYHAYIDSEHVDGVLNFAHAILPGESKEEILISTYVCHPSMANNELSGPIVATFLYNRLKKWKKRRFTYRFVFVPETIGSISYLYKFGNELKKNTYSGLVLTCLGGKVDLSYKHSRQGNAPIDRVVNHFFEGGLKGSTRAFTPNNGSDERQYCSPGFNLPVGQMARLTYGQYKEYHTSLDNKELITIKSLQKSVNEIECILQGLELEGYYVNLSPFGEVKLDKHGLYPDINSQDRWTRADNEAINHREILNWVLSILNYSDGEHTLLQIAEKCNCSILDLEPVIDILKSKGILEGPYTNQRGLHK
ncbi:DUF4910 domain-containing protein [Bacillus sp. CGMCC 1.16607]|uniref:DUF4910 domain-containing protein n=1 Tax=Bacillus sp. CGMCC 1.16607 TaxID=3351842 RepID=UPI00363714A9